MEKVLFIGGTGVISSACSRLAVERGFDLTLFNRGKTDRQVPSGARVIHGDIRDAEAARYALGDEYFDVVVDWVGFEPEHVEADIRLFAGRTGQYVFISSAATYKHPPAVLPVTEAAPQSNRHWQYARDKIACERRLMRAHLDEDFPVTLVRPSHTYDQTKVPVRGYYTTIDRMRRGKKVIVQGDGTSLWCLTHHEDFARGFVGLLGNYRAIGEAVHITSDELLNWDQITEELARAAGAEAQIVHVPTDLIAAYDRELGEQLLGDKTYSMIFDNTKIKRLVPDFAATIPFSRGAKEIVAWYDADPARRQIDERFNALADRLIEAMESAWPERRS
jgi:nucleoside-diphosphate-sugar epimerase